MGMNGRANKKENYEIQGASLRNYVLLFNGCGSVDIRSDRFKWRVDVRR
jgi:hypothetical protein